MEHLDPDDMVLLALGDHAGEAGDASAGGSSDVGDDSRRHLEHCTVCRTELTGLTRTVELARAAGEVGPQGQVVLPPGIWTGIAAELGIGVDPLGAGGAVPVQRGSGSGGRTWVTGSGDKPGQGDLRGSGDLPGSGDQEGARRRNSGEPSGAGGRPRLTTAWRRGRLVAAVVAAVAVGITAGVVIGQRQATATAAVQYQADLKPMAAGPADAHATAVVTQAGGAQTLTVSARQLPLRQGYYEVWLYNPTADKMVAVGTLGSTGDGAFTLASTIDLRSYSVVDVSAQDFDGDPAHKTSMLQGPLTQ